MYIYKHFCFATVRYGVQLKATSNFAGLILSIRQLGGSLQILCNHKIIALELSTFICYSK